ncbi:IS66 family transposase [Amycolatopsis lexingtonensis]|uniref:IS66 family transposase n=1 Tax=Amycolatopsis lexingtonensis TaxID=218822 RepID=UPI003F720ECF
MISGFVRTIHLGLLLHPPSRDRKQSKTRNLLVRLRDYQHQVLFARDLTVPFTTNQAERDLRMIKAQLKISGGWRTHHGAPRRGCGSAVTSPPPARTASTSSPRSVTPSRETLGCQQLSKWPEQLP